MIAIGMDVVVHAVDVGERAAAADARNEVVAVVVAGDVAELQLQQLVTSCDYAWPQLQLVA